MNCKKIIYFTIFLFLVISCKKSLTNEKLEINSYKHDSLIVLAEYEILKEDYEKGLDYYKEASNHINKMYALDLYNSLIASIYLEDWKESAIFSGKLIDKGANRSFFNQAIFKKFKTTPQWVDLEKNIIKSYTTFSKTSDQVMIDSLGLLQEIDQKEYCLIPTGRIDLSNAFDKTVFIDSLLNKLIKNRGYPNEEKVGLNIINDTFISPLPKFFPLLRHSYQANSNLIDLHLKNAVQNGYLKKNVLEKISGIDKMEYLVINCKVYKLKSLSIKGNMKSELYVKKILYNNRIKKDFIFYAPLSIINGKPQEMFGNEFEKMYEYICDYSNCIE